jgi:hypothetical protein
MQSIDQNSLLKLIIDTNICEIILHVFFRLCNYCILLYVKGLPASGLGEGLTIPYRKKPTCLGNVTWHHHFGAFVHRIMNILVM